MALLINSQLPIPNYQPLPLSNYQLSTAFNLGIGSWELWALVVGDWELRSVQIEVPDWPRNRLAPCLLQRFLEPARQRIVSRLLRFNRLLEERLTPGSFRRQDSLRVVQLGLIAALRFAVRDDATKVRIDDER